MDKILELLMSKPENVSSCNQGIYQQIQTYGI